MSDGGGTASEADRGRSAADDAAARSGRLGEVLAASLRLGLTSFGGPIAHLGYFRHEYVERRGWLDDASFADLVALSQVLPGPTSSQLGIAIGARRAGMAGGLAAWLGFTLPSAVVMLLLALLATRVDVANAGWVHGLKLAAVAVVAQAVVLMARSLAPDWSRRAIAVAAAAVVLAWGSPVAPIAVIAAGALVGWLGLHGARVGAVEPEPERLLGAPPIPPRVGIASLVAFVALLVALPLLRVVGGHAVELVDAFYRSGALVFGGGHVVLPLLYDAVVVPGWVAPDTFLAGYGAAQAVPGPLFSFAAYLGAVERPAPNGVGGGLLALVAIYLPSFLLLFGVLPFWDRVRTAVSFRRALAGTNAAVVGILAAALYTPIWTSAVTHPVDAVLAAAGFGALVTGRVPPIAVVAGCALAGALLG